MSSVARGSVDFQVFKPTIGSTLGKSHTNVRCVERASVRDQIFRPTRESTQERNHTHVMHVVRVFAGAQVS